MNDHLFPRYHICSPSGFLNDPNGPVLVDGRYHLYFQHRRTLEASSPVSWGHVSSADLVHWEGHSPALTPHASALDRDGCWSGNTVIDASGRVRAFYSGLVRGERLQRTLSAASDDGGFSFGPPQEVVPAPPAGEHIRHLRDPFVWRQGAGWHMVIGAGADDDIGLLRHYTSEDLSTWSYAGPLARMARPSTAEWDSGVMWECPQVLPAGDRTAVLFGSWTREAGVMQVLSALVPPQPGGPDLIGSDLHLVDHGPNFYAASVMQTSPAGPLVWGWATEGRSAEWSQEDGWSGMLTLPRSVRLRPDGAVASSPIPPLALLRSAQSATVVSAGSTGSLDGLGAQLEFLIERTEDSARTCTLRMHFGRSECLDVTIDRAAGRVTIDRNRASDDDRAKGDLTTIDGLDESRSTAETIRGYLDGSILELFLPGGRVATIRFYPTTPPPWRLELLGERAGNRVQVWELQAGWSQTYSTG